METCSFSSFISLFSFVSLSRISSFSLFSSFPRFISFCSSAASPTSSGSPASAASSGSSASPCSSDSCTMVEAGTDGYEEGFCFFCTADVGWKRRRWWGEYSFRGCWVEERVRQGQSSLQTRTLGETKYPKYTHTHRFCVCHCVCVCEGHQISAEHHHRLIIRPDPLPVKWRPWERSHVAAWC